MTESANLSDIVNLNRSDLSDIVPLSLFVWSARDGNGLEVYNAVVDGTRPSRLEQVSGTSRLRGKKTLNLHSMAFLLSKSVAMDYVRTMYVQATSERSITFLSMMIAWHPWTTSERRPSEITSAGTGSRMSGADHSHYSCSFLCERMLTLNYGR